MRLPFVTNRNLDTDKENVSYFGGGRGEPSAGVCSVVLEEPERLKSKARVVRVEQLPFDDALVEGNPSDRALMYVHGFNMGFEKGCRRAARLQQNLGIARRLLLFSWPADGNYLNYVGDVVDLEWSEQDVERALLRLTEAYAPGRIDLIGHSLGARGLVEALANLSRSDRQGIRFGRLILVAPDIDRDIFRQNLERVSRVVTDITVYVSNKDKALGLSNRLNRQARLGQSRTSHTLPLPGVTVVDVSAVKVRDITGHLYHLYNPAVVEDLKRLLGTFDGDGAYRRVAVDGMQRLEPRAADES